ncbi:MAG: hypothetical protein KQJ78_23030 [Deltaproteobacteria bacterium]|nr:hypothetical protein [Deltaproteobacteria bacterium]
MGRKACLVWWLAVVLLLTAAEMARAGSMVEATCANCGYHQGMGLFGGKADFETHCDFPVYCVDCKQLEVVNLYAERTVCQACPNSRAVPYDDPSLLGKKGAKVITSWNTQKRLGRSLVLTDGDYLCPNCGKFTLHFQQVGLYD